MTEGANWWGLAGFAVLIIGFGLLFLFLTILPDRRNRSGLAALAARRGWTITHASGDVKKGEGGTWVTRVTPTDGSGWTCSVTLFIVGNRQVRKTEFQDSNPDAQSGSVVIGPPIGGADAALASNLLSMGGGSILESMLQERLGDAPDLANLKPVPDQGAGQATVFATPAAKADPICPHVLPLISSWRATHSAEKLFPIVIVSPRMIRVRLRMDASRPDLLEAFIDHALATRDAIGRAA